MCVQIEELVRLGELTKRAWARDVQVMVEGPGHADGSDCSEYEDSADDLHGSTVLCTGTAGNGHCAEGTTISLPRSEERSPRRMERHFVLCDTGGASGASNVEDVGQGIIASKIAAHAADIAKACGAQERSTTRWQTHAAC